MCLVENEWYGILYTLKINTTHSCALSWLEKLKSNEVDLTYRVREEEVCVGHHFPGDLIPASLQPKKDGLHWSPEAREIGKNLLGHLINSPAIAGNHSIEILFITWSAFTTESGFFFNQSVVFFQFHTTQLPLLNFSVFSSSLNFFKGHATLPCCPSEGLSSLLLEDSGISPHLSQTF